MFKLPSLCILLWQPKLANSQKKKALFKKKKKCLETTREETESERERRQTIGNCRKK